MQQPWVTLLRPNGEVRRDRKGRLRPVKGRVKVPILIAMGLWPESDRCEILLWRLGESESAEESVSSSRPWKPRASVVRTA
jgi:hypothetical protein